MSLCHCPNPACARAGPLREKDRDLRSRALSDGFLPDEFAAKNLSGAAGYRDSHVAHALRHRRATSS